MDLARREIAVTLQVPRRCLTCRLYSSSDNLRPGSVCARDAIPRRRCCLFWNRSFLDASESMMERGDCDGPLRWQHALNTIELRREY